MGRYYCGLDLGQTSDYSALSVVQKATPQQIKMGMKRLSLIGLVRWRNLLYPQIARNVAEILDAEPFVNNHDLIIDATGVGPAVVDIYTEQGRSFKAVKITGGEHEREGTEEERALLQQDLWYVPKRNLVSSLQVLLQSEGLSIAEDLHMAETFVEELMNFRIKINVKTGHDAYEAWREGDHDDLVLAAALGVWAAQKFGTEPVAPVGLGAVGGSYWRGGA